MDCEECGNEMIVEDLSEFYTEYVCPWCGHEQIFYPMPEEDLDVLIEDNEGYCPHCEGYGVEG